MTRGNCALLLVCALSHGCARATVPLDSGCDPYRLIAVDDGFVGILRGRGAVVLLDGALRERARAAAPASPTGITRTPQGDLFVSGELGGAIAHYRVADGALVPSGQIPLSDVRAVRDVAAGADGTLYLVEEERGRLITLWGTAREEEPVGHGCVDIEYVDGYLLINCILDHSIVVRAPDKSVHRIVHDGPIWSFAARVVDGKLELAAGGIEDHPLDRSDGTFGNVDSYLYFYRISNSIETLAKTNLSQHDVVTPKAIAFADARTVLVSGYGGEKLARVTLDGATVSTSPLPPGSSSVARGRDGAWAFANPLLDAWVRVADGAPELVPAGEKGEERVGEALLFTTLIAPKNVSEGKRSRFTCEACHFEGYIDGRTHYSGRGQVRVTTKPLHGLGNNAPFFSRALDPDLPKVVDAEFRAAAAGGGGDPWFTVETAEHPWLRALGVAEDRLSPERLRVALTKFLERFHHRPNPLVFGRAQFSDEERRGAEAFSARCAGCHEARPAATASRALPLESWEAALFGAAVGPVWARGDYRKTGVEPYVHAEGARVPSLRRLYKKWPYFTNGSAKSLDELLARVRVGTTFTHHGGEGEPLDEATRAQLRAFLQLL